MDAARTVADRDGLSALSVSDVTQLAGVAKGTFYVHFADRASLMVALHRSFHDKLFARLITRSTTTPAGLERAEEHILAFLDGCLEQPGVRAMLLEARSEPAIRVEVNRRNHEAATDLSLDLSAAGHPQPFETAQLLVAATAEVAVLELDAGTPLTSLRAALIRLVRPPT